MAKSNASYSSAWFIIPEQIINEADKCTKEKACLSDPYYDLCRIKTGRKSKVARIAVCEEKICCTYCSNIGEQQVCSCPVRHAIYRKYGV